MNEVLEAIKTRRSTKSFKSEMVDDSVIKKIVEAATYSPSGRNLQSSVMVVVKTKSLRDKLSKMNADILGITSDPFYNAPVVIVVLAKKDVSTCVEDGSIVISNLLLAASSMGVGSCWIHRAKEMFETPEGEKLLEEWNLKGYRGIGNCILGYEKEDYKKPILKRKDNYIIYK